MSEEQQPDNVLEFKPAEPVPQEPPFILNIPMPRPAHIQKIMDELETKPAEEKDVILKALEKFYAAFYFAATSMTQPPEFPEELKGLSPQLMQIIHAFIPREFKSYHFERGFLSLPEETQKEILAAQRRAREDAKLYAHLPQDGATMPGGQPGEEIRKVLAASGCPVLGDKLTVDHLKTLVDRGVIPPNPALGNRVRKPDYDMTNTGGIIAPVEKPKEIIKP